LYYKFYYYNFEESGAEIKKGVVAVSTGIVRYNRIQNLYIDQDFLDRVLGLYDVHYETAGETSSFYSHVDGLNNKNSDKLLEFLKERIGNPNIEREEKNNITENSNDTQKDDSTILFSRENITLSKKYLFTSAIFNAEILILIGLIASRMVIEITKNIMPINWLYVLLAMPPIFLITMIYSWFWFKFFYFEFKNKSVHIKKGVISRSSQYIYYNRIQNININQSFLNRLLGISYLNVETAGEGSATFQIPGLEVEDATKLRNFLMEKSRKHQAI
jgi:putative membrane protein